MTRRNLNIKMEDGIVYKEERQNIPRKQVGKCYWCDIPVFVSQGQLLKWYKGQPTHKSCRKNA